MAWGERHRDVSDTEEAENSKRCLSGGYNSFGKETLKDNKGNKTMNNIMEDLTKNIKNTAEVSKDAFITQQVGQTVLSSVKNSLLATPMDARLKAFFDSSYGDIAIGVALNTLIPTLNLSSRADFAVKQANTVAVMQASSKITFLQDVLVQVIEKAAESIPTKDVPEDIKEEESS